MHILLVAHDGEKSGGASLALLDLIDELVKFNDVKITVLCPNRRGGLVEKLKERKIKYVVSKYFWWVYKSDGKIISKIKWLIKRKLNYILSFYISYKVKDKNIDLIHTNSSVVDMGARIASILNKPHIWHVREFGEEHMGLTFPRGTKRSRKYMDRKSSKIIVISKALRNKYTKYVNEKKIELIYDGLPSKYENILKRDSECVKNNNLFNITIVGRVQRGKGQLQAIKAVKELIEEENVNINLLVAGDIMDDDYYNEIKKYIGENDHSIKFLGQVDNVNKLRELSDIELVCSEMEGFGRVTVEAMLSKLPVIASNSGANCELVQEGVSGFIYTLNDIVDLKEKILKLIINEKLRSIMGQNGYEMAKDMFMQDINAKKIHKLYREIIENKSDK